MQAVIVEKVKMTTNPHPYPPDFCTWNLHPTDAGSVTSLLMLLALKSWFHCSWKHLFSACVVCAGINHIIMSQTRSSFLINMRATPSVAVNNILRQNFSPSVSARSLSHRLAAVLVAAFFATACIVHNFITLNRRNLSESRTLLLWNVSCIFTAVQLSLTCWFLYTIAPGIRLISELVAWLFYGFGYFFSYLVGYIMCSLSVVIIPAYVCYRAPVPQAEIWPCACRLTVAAVFVTFVSGILIDRLTTVTYWLTIAAGVLLTVTVRLAAICVLVGGALLSLLNVEATKLNIGASNRLDTNYGNLLQFDDQDDTLIQRRTDHPTTNSGNPRSTGEDVTVNRPASNYGNPRFSREDATVNRRPTDNVWLRNTWSFLSVQCR